MTAHLSEVDRRRMARTGLPSLSSEEALAMFDAALGRPEAALVAARFDTAALARGAGRAAPGARTDGAVPALLRGLVRHATPRTRSAPQAASLQQRLATLSPDDRERVLLDLVRSEAAAVLDLGAAAALPPQRAIQELGLDSLMALELRNRLSAATGLRLQATLLFNYPTPAALARHIQAQLAPAQTKTASPALAELDKLQAALVELGSSDVGRAMVTSRLKALLAGWSDGAGDRAAGADLQGVTDDELFDVLDQELVGLELSK
jgi:acyl carrier protein